MLMKKSHKRAPEEEYQRFRNYFPFCCVDLVIFKNKSVLLTKRTCNPYKGKWHLPGSMIHKNERMKDAVRRSAKEELNLDVKIEKYLGVYESLNSFRHDVSHGFIVCVLSGKLKLDFQSSKLKFFKKIPNNVLPHHRKIIRDARVD